ncbi:MAG: hypothetical protein JXR83_20735 [Deltaproteobacteria bacterium]|nr:hypothetical protein [Deltaproteobacteria bacterium]
MSDFEHESSSFERMRPSQVVRRAYAVLRPHFGNIIAVSMVKTVAGRLGRTPEQITLAELPIFVDALVVAAKLLPSRGEVERELRALLTEAQTWTQSN